MTAPTERVDELVVAARAAMERGSYAPYSTFNMGAAVLAEGEVSIDAVAVVSRADEPTPPCGGCRQVLNEFGPDMTVTVESATGERAVWRLTEILPHAFGPSNLRK